MVKSKQVIDMENDLEFLRHTLAIRVKESGSLHHPYVIEISQKMDALINRIQRHKDSRKPLEVMTYAL